MKRAGLAFAMAVFLTACSAEERSGTKKERPLVSNVQVVTVSLVPIAEMFEVVGTVRSERQSVLASKTLARVTAVLAREGDRVRTGQLLIELDDRDVRAQLRQAEAALQESQNAHQENEKAIRAAENDIQAALAERELARSTAGRYRRLFEQQTISRQQYDETLARQKAATARLGRAREMKESLIARSRRLSARVVFDEEGVVNARVLLGHSRISAPFDGVVVAKTAEVGNMASPGTPLLTVEQESYRLEIALSGSDMGKVGIGQEAGLSVNALEAGVRGKVVEIVPLADPVSRTSIVKISLPAVPGLRSGLYGKARFEAGKSDLLLVPAGAVAQRGQLESLFVVDKDGVARLRLVKTGKKYGERTEILAGLSPGERIAVAGEGRLSEGSRIETTP